ARVRNHMGGMRSPADVRMSGPLIRHLPDGHRRITYLYFRGAYMTNVASNTPAAKPETAETSQIVLKEISAKRGKFEQDFSALKGKDDFVTYRGKVQQIGRAHV